MKFNTRRLSSTVILLLFHIEIYKILVIIMTVTMKELMNLKRKIKRAKSVKTLERYGKQLDKWIEEIRLSNRPISSLGLTIFVF